MPGADATLTVGSAVAQCAVTTTNAFGGAGRLSTTPARNPRSLSQARGPNGGGDSIQKQGPPPCGRKNVGWRGEVISWGSQVQILASQPNAFVRCGKSGPKAIAPGIRILSGKAERRVECRAFLGEKRDAGN